MGIVISYDEKFGLPNSEIELASGERILLTLGRDGLATGLLARPGRRLPDAAAMRAARAVNARRCRC